MIKTDIFLHEQGTESEMRRGFAEFHALNALVDSFAYQMKRALQKKAQEGQKGWDQPEYKDIILEKLIANSQQGSDYVGIANLAAMLWNFEQPGMLQPNLTVILIPEHEANAIRKGEKRHHIVDDNSLEVNDIIKFQEVGRMNLYTSKVLLTKVTHIENPNGVAIRNGYKLVSIQFLYEIQEKITNL